MLRLPTFRYRASKGDKKRKKIVLVLVVVGVSVLVVILSLLTFVFCRRKRQSAAKKLISSGEEVRNKSCETGEGGFGDPGEDHAANKEAKCASAIGCFEEITANAHGKMIALFLDYDGTLSPIVNEPDKAFMSSEMQDAVRSAAELFPTSIVSGRSYEKVKEFVKLDELHYSGSHGMVIKMNDQSKPFTPASEYEPMITEATQYLEKATRTIKGSAVENNVFCVSVHYRNVDEKEWELVEKVVRDTLECFPELRPTRGHMVIELRPPIKWNKGDAVEHILHYLLEKLGLEASQVLSIYIGDDVTDEDAFKVLRGQNNGLGILVSQEPRETAASYSLENPTEVMKFLNELVGWRKAASEALTDGKIVETSRG